MPFPDTYAVRLQLRQPLRRATLARRRTQMRNFPPPMSLCRGIAQDEAAARRSGDRLFEHELHRGFAAGQDRRIAEQHDAGTDFGRGVMQAHGHPLAYWLLLGREQPQSRVDPIGRRVQIRIEHDPPAVDRISVTPHR